MKAEARRWAEVVREYWAMAEIAAPVHEVWSAWVTVRSGERGG